MKIKKFNEKVNDRQSVLDDFVELIVDKFLNFADTMGTYSCIIYNDRVRLIFQFAVITQDEMDDLKTLITFVNNYDNRAELFFTPVELEADLLIIECEINIDDKHFSKIYKELQLNSDADKYNL